MNELKVLRLDARAKLPTVAYPGEDNGYDIYALEDFFVGNDHIHYLPTGFAAHQEGYGFLIVTRSSMPGKGLVVIPSLIDSGYRGEWHVCLRSGPNRAYQIRAGDRIAQAVPVANGTGTIIEVKNLEDLGESARGGKGFGSSGQR